MHVTTKPSHAFHDVGASSNLTFFSEGELDVLSSAFLFVAPPVGSPFASTGGFFFFLTIDVKSLTCVGAVGAAPGAPAPSSLSRAFAAMTGADSDGSLGIVLSSSTWHSVQYAPGCRSLTRHAPSKQGLLSSLPTPLSPKPSVVDSNSGRRRPRVSTGPWREPCPCPSGPISGESRPSFGHRRRFVAPQDAPRHSQGLSQHV